MELCGTFLQSVGSKCYLQGVKSTIRHREALTTGPKDTKAAEKLNALMANTGLSPEVLGAQTGVSGKRIRQILDHGIQPQRRIRYALARRFELLPSDIWKCDKSTASALSPAELEHLRGLARRTEQVG